MPKARKGSWRTPVWSVTGTGAAEQGIDIDFVQRDAQTASFDQPLGVVVSRFGVMFFDNPQIAFA